MTSFVGNDLVDLRAAHNRGRARQPRFIERVLTAAEREWLAPHAGADHRFALFWSAKEAAYKAAKKRDPALVFAPRRWQVEIGPPSTPSGTREGFVTIAADARITVRWNGTDEWLHCVALLGSPPAALDDAVATTTDVKAHGDFSAREHAGVTCTESAAVRALAKRLLRHRGAGEIEILRPRSGFALLPPRVHAGPAPLAGVDLSLSHDGRFVAAVIAIDRGSPVASVSNLRARDRRGEHGSRLPADSTRGTG